MEKLNKKLIVLTLFVLLLSNPFQLITAQSRSPQPVSCRQAAEQWELLLAITAFGLAFVPPLAPVAVFYGVAALGAKAYAVTVCGEGKPQRV